MATTPNYSWVMPDPTDFVTDLPADFEIFGDAVDASLYALSPGTTAGDLDYYTSSTAKARLGYWHSRTSACKLIAVQLLQSGLHLLVDGLTGLY
jgi:hypothetical protein